MKFFRNHWELFLLVGIVVAVTALLFRQIVGNMSGQLYDWNDYPLIFWIIDQHLDHFFAGNWSQFFQSNMFFPFSDSLLFSDLLLPSAFLTGVVSLVTVDRVVAFNFVFLATWALNAVAGWSVWRRVWSGQLLFVASVFTAFMPFIIINTAHFQMSSIWPFLFGFSFLLQQKRTWQQALWLGIWTGITFVSSVYLAIFLMYCIGVWVVVQVFAERKKITQSFQAWGTWLGVLGLTIGILVGPFAYRYFQMRQFYHAQRPYAEYVTYSAGLLDYFSSSGYSSVFTGLPIVQRWNSMIATSAGGFFPGFVLIGLALANVLIFVRANPRGYGIGVRMDRRAVFFMILIVSGLLFALGPRLKVGSIYIGPPLPYAVLLKFIPLFEPIRATARWTFLANIGLLYFAVLGLEIVLRKISNRQYKWALVSVLVLLYFVEVLPIKRSIEAPNETQHIDTHLVTLCKSQSVLLEYPITYNPYGDHRGIIDMLQHWTGVILDATAHQCKVVNGYSGFFPAEYSEYDARVSKALGAGDVAGFDTALQDRTVEILRVHTAKLTATESATIQEWIGLTVPELLYQDEREQVLRIH